MSVRLSWEEVNDVLNQKPLEETATRCSQTDGKRWEKRWERIKTVVKKSIMYLTLLTDALLPCFCKGRMTALMVEYCQRQRSAALFFRRHKRQCSGVCAEWQWRPRYWTSHIEQGIVKFYGCINLPSAWWSPHLLFLFLVLLPLLILFYFYLLLLEFPDLPESTVRSLYVPRHPL